MSLDYPLPVFFFISIWLSIMDRLKSTYTNSKQVEFVKGRKRNMSLIQITIGFLHHRLKRKKKKKVLWIKSEIRALGFVHKLEMTLSPTPILLYFWCGGRPVRILSFLKNRFLCVSVSWSFHKFRKNWEGKEYSWIKVEKVILILIAWLKEPR